MSKIFTHAEKPTQDTTRDLLLALVDEANETQIPYDRPEPEPLHPEEWTGVRAKVDRSVAEPVVPEA